MSGIQIGLPDGKTISFSAPVTVAEVAGRIGPGLARAALAARVNGRTVDLSHRLESDAAIEILTARDPEGLEVLRHSAAHLLAQAVKELYPDAQVAIGPVIADGFYYDFSCQRTFAPEDLERIEVRMREIVKRDLPIERIEISRADAVAFFRAEGERYKAEIADSIPAGEILTLYRQNGFTDLCRGPHVPSTGRIKVFKLTHVAGAYWRGDSRNEMLQRIYGTAWGDKAALETYLCRREEAARRDHRRIGRELDLFHFQAEAGGSAFWHPRGWTLYRLIQDYMRGELEPAGYREIRTPQLLSRRLWEASGHWEKFRGDMFTVEAIGEPLDLALKPMNCPGHVQVFKQGLKSYRELPLRLAEFGSCHRYEPSGALHGLMRMRAFTQDDAHIFCTEAQIETETRAFCDLLQRIYTDFGFKSVSVKFSDRPENRVGSDQAWDRAEAALEGAALAAGLDLARNPGEGAFYGPKLEFILRDAIGRDWQCGTLQVDLVLPERLGAEYIGEDGGRHHPVMLHRAILGSFERFIGILIEHYAGRLPPWLAPVQAVVIAITEAHSDYARRMVSRLRQLGYRATADLRNETIGYKIREHTLKRIPYLLIVGRREQEAGTLSVRNGLGKDLGVMSVADFAARLAGDVALRGKFNLED